MTGCVIETRSICETRGRRVLVLGRAVQRTETNDERVLSRTSGVCLGRALQRTETRPMGLVMEEQYNGQRQMTSEFSSHGHYICIRPMKSAVDIPNFI